MGKISSLGLLLDNILSRLISLERDRSEGKQELVNQLLQILPNFCSQNGADLNLDQLRKAAMFSRAYIEVIADHYPQFAKFRVEEQISVLQVSYRWSDFEKTAKWVLSAPIAKHLNQEVLADGLPPKPPGEIHLFPFSPPVKRWLTDICRSRKYKKNLHFFTSLLLGVKRACAEPSREMVQKQLASHSSGLSKEPPQLKFPKLASYFHRALRGVERFKPGPLKDTGGASFNTTRSLGGKFEEVVRLWNGCTFSEPLHNTDLYWVEPDGRCFYGREVPTYNQIRTLLPKVDFVKAIGLLEALKVRVITTGNAATSVYLERPRKQLHDFLRRIACLSPLDRPKIQESDLRSLHQKEANLGLQFPWWVSGDYSAATDNLNSAVTKTAIEIICQAIGCEEDKGIFESSLLGTHLKYPTCSGLDSEQKNGQLMGNPLSFPILCLTNLAGYWSALEQYYGRPIEVENLPVLINGDDILFRADKEFLELWRDKIKNLGFSLSIGKYYVHPRVCTLNSQFFLDFKEIGYYNPGLLYKGFAGNKKKTQFLPVEAVAEEILRGAWNKPRAFNWFKHYWGSTLRVATNSGRQNLFLPRSAGGLGCKPIGLIEGTDYFVSEENKRLAYSLHRLQNWHPVLALDWTNCPMRENLNKDNSICYQRWSKGSVWLEADKPDYAILEARGFPIQPHKKEIRDRSLSLLKPQSELRFPTFQMGVPIQAGDPLYLPKVQELPAFSPGPDRFLPSPDRLDFEDLDREVKVLPPGARRIERSFDPKVEAMWWRRISKRDFSRLYCWFPPPPDLPDPVERKLQRYSGKINPISSSI